MRIHLRVLAEHLTQSKRWQRPQLLLLLIVEVFSCHHTNTLEDSGREGLDGGGDNMSPPQVRKAPPNNLNRDGAGRSR